MNPNITSSVININNVQNVRNQIEHHRHGKFTTINEVQNITTDYDVFPYPRWFRGEYKNSNPVIAEREAGYRPLQPNCYQTKQNIVNEKYPNHCFESACSTVYPCYPDYLAKLSDRSAMNVLLNKACTIQYR
jgi:hypothetical protein